MSRHPLLVLVAALAAVVSAEATSYPPVTFSELVSRADVIFVGDIADVRPFAVDTRDGRIIKTRVTFRVRDALLGASGGQEVFEFLGGRLDGVEMRVADMPTFAVGDRRVIFARRTRSINPIVGFTHGLLQIRTDSSGVDRIWTIHGTALARPESIGVAADRGTAALSSPMRLSEFRERITRALVEARRK